MVSTKKCSFASILIANNPLKGAKKSTFDMNQNELEQTAQSILRRAREKAFSTGEWDWENYFRFCTREYTCY